MGAGQTMGAQYAKHISWNTKLFDSKIAEVAENKYDGINGGDKWMEWAFEYFVGHCPDCYPVMQWISRRGTLTITNWDIEQLSVNNSLQISVDPLVIAGHMWSFLRLNLTVIAQ